MRIVQLLPTLSYGDAVSNDAIALSGVISGMGYDTGIYAEIIDKRLPAGTARKADKLTAPGSDDIIIYHKSTGTDLDKKLGDFPCRKIMIYHNITPPEFFRPYNTEAAALTSRGYEGLRQLRDKVDMCLAVSEYNKADLLRYGYTCPIEVRPILIPFSDYDKEPDGDTLARFNDGRTNILFVGRIAPNKKQEDVIRAFFRYKELDPSARLILAGSWAGFENYADRLKDYTKALGIAGDVIFTGKCSFAEILAYYRTASAFLCMSEHEGFCVPLVEAMHFGVPVAARDTSAIAGTLGGSGMLLPDSDPVFAARVIQRIVHDTALREQIVAEQKRRLEDFSYEKIRALFEAQLKDFIAKG